MVHVCARVWRQRSTLDVVPLVLPNLLSLFFLIEFLIRCINMYGGCACVYERVIVCV